MTIRLRKATTKDLPLLKNFENKLIAYERSIEPTLIQHGPLKYYNLSKLLKDTKKVIILIAEIDNEAVGCGLGQIKKNDPCYNESHYGYIGLIYVDKSKRRKNIGKLIVQELTDWFHNKKIVEIRLEVFANNLQAINAYKNYGFKPYMQEMRLQK